MKENRERVEEKMSDSGLVIVAHAEDWDLANDYALILKDHGIEGVVEHREGEAAMFGFSLKVPQDFFDEAHMIIESQQTHNDFYDFFFDESYFEDDLLNDDLDDID